MPDVVLLDMNFHTDINSGNEGLYWTGELKRMWECLSPFGDEGDACQS